MADVTVTYKGSTIAELSASGNKTLQTAGKYCEADIGLNYVKTGGNPTALMNDVIFIDYDGAIRYSYTAAEFAALSELPPNPAHDGLAAQGWNWTLTDAKTYVADYGGLCIGQCYNTDDGRTKIYLACESAGPVDITIYFTQTVSQGVTLSTSDGRTPWTVSGTGVVNTTLNGVQGPFGFWVYFTVTNGKMALSPGSTYRTVTPLWLMRRAHIGLTDNQTPSFATADQTNLEALTIPRGLNDYGTSRLFYNVKSAAAMVVADGVSTPGPGFCLNGSLRYISLPKSVNPYYNEMFSGAPLRGVFLPQATTAVTSKMFLNDTFLHGLKVPSEVTEIRSQALYGCTGLTEIVFYRAVTPLATVENSNAWGSIPTSCKIYVPFAALKDYLTGTNYPAPASYTYIGFATYQNGVTLPTQDTTSTYSVRWYATKADAIAQTNVILSGNGKEIYCRYST